MRTATILLFTLAASAHAQTLTIRDTLRQGPIGSCAATHGTATTGVNAGSRIYDLKRFPGPVEIVGSMRRPTGCPPYLDVVRIRAVPNLKAVTSRTTSGFQLQLSGSPTRTYLVAIGGLQSGGGAFTIPSIVGPVHLAPNGLFVLGSFAVQSTTPFATFTAASVPTGVRFYFQAIAIQPTRAETTIVVGASF